MRTLLAALFAALATSCAAEHDAATDRHVAIFDAEDAPSFDPITAAAATPDRKIGYAPAPPIPPPPREEPPQEEPPPEEPPPEPEPFDCGTISDRCNPDVRCVDPTHACSGEAGVCLPADPPECGGYSKVQCPSDRPVCLYHQDTDYGVCVIPEVHDCVCDTPAGRTYFFC